MHLKTYLVYMFLLLQFLPLPEIVALDSKQTLPFPSWGGEQAEGPRKGGSLEATEAFRDRNDHFALCNI